MKKAFFEYGTIYVMALVWFMSIISIISLTNWHTSSSSMPTGMVTSSSAYGDGGGSVPSTQRIIVTTTGNYYAKMNWYNSAARIYLYASPGDAMIGEFYGYYPALPSEVFLGNYIAGTEIAFKHTYWWNDQTGKIYSTDASNYQIENLGNNRWRLTFDDGLHMGALDGQFEVYRKDVAVTTCNDSDKYARDPYYVKGTVSLYRDGNLVDSSTDSCLSSTSLSEGYCDGSTGSQISYICPYGCSDGACKKAPVTKFANFTASTHIYPEKILIVGSEWLSSYIYADAYVLNDLPETLSSATVTLSVQGLGLSQIKTVTDINPGESKSTEQFHIDVPSSIQSGAYDVMLKLEYIYNGKSYSSIIKENRQIARFSDITCVKSDNGDEYVRGTATITFPTGYKYSVTDDCCTDCATAPSPTGPSVSEYSCDGNFFRRGWMTCPNGCSDGACKNKEIISTSLKDYPEMIYSGSAVIGRIVIGEYASSDDVLIGVDIASALLKSSSAVNPTATSIAILDKDADYSIPYVIINSPCVNRVSEWYMDSPELCAEGQKEGVGRLDFMTKTPGKPSIMVSGYNQADVKAAGRVLANWAAFESKVVEGKSLCVNTTIGATSAGVYVCDSIGTSNANMAVSFSDAVYTKTFYNDASIPEKNSLSLFITNIGSGTIDLGYYSLYIEGTGFSSKYSLAAYDSTFKAGDSLHFYQTGSSEAGMFSDNDCDKNVFMGLIKDGVPYPTHNVLSPSYVSLECKRIGIAEPSYTLGDYPSPFMKDGLATGVFVIGEKGSVQDNIGITDILVSLQRTTENPLPSVKMDSQVGSWSSMVAVGGPCVNSKSADLMGNPANCLQGFESGVGMIKLYPEKNALLIAGYSADDTLKAAKVLANWQDYARGFKGQTEVCVTGSLSNLKVGSC